MIRFRPRTLVVWSTCLLALSASSFLPAGSVHAATRAVSNCNDSGAGSLRNAIAGALSGDTIDMTALTCSPILLTSGEIVVPQPSLYLVGRSRSALTIDGNDTYRVFRHTHIGRFRLSHVTVANGRATAEQPDGGCILSEFGEVELVRARVQRCVAGARGGAIYARVVLMTESAAAYNATSNQGGAIWGGTVRVLSSQIYGNRGAFGGGIYSTFDQGGVALSYSLLKDNLAARSGGGMYVTGAGFARINKSTITGNRAQSDRGQGGGLYAYVAGGPLIVDSTVSGNQAGTYSAMYANSPRIYNSTIAFNVETFECNAAVEGPGLMVSSIVARNTCLVGPGFDVNYAQIFVSDSLIERPRYRAASDTIQADPRLAPLANNGGPTPTHALMSDSPAIDRGSNPLDRAYDQRGPGFPRVRGAFPDIGAFER